MEWLENGYKDSTMKANILMRGVIHMIKEMVLVQKAVSKVFGDFVSKVVSDGTDILKSKIKEADQNRKSYDQNLQTRIYQVTVDALNKFTYNKYMNQDKLYDAAESIIKGYISNKDNTDAAKSGLNVLVSGVSSNTCQEFLVTLCEEICREENSDLYKKIDMLWKKQESEYIHSEFEKSNQNGKEILEQLNSMEEILDFIKENMNSQRENKEEHYEIPIKNRAREYADKWDRNVFLNDFNEEDENAGVNIKLSELYIEKCLPHYIWKTNRQSKDTLRNLLMKYIINVNEKKMLLILGQPGIGKSTLITWIIANLVENMEQIFVYQFTSDLGSVDWQSNNLLDEIFSTTGLKYNELEGKSLILDGFDEISVKEDRERILHKLNQELEKKNYLRKFSLVLTCRENYVDKVELKGIEYITLQAWGETQIRSFCETYEEILMSKDSARINENSEIRNSKIIEKKDIMGIPLILYMVLALNVDIEKSSSTVDIYDQVFSLKKGGIYDREYDIEHRINAPEIKRHIHQISQRIAFWIFENNAGEATIPQEKFEEICNHEMQESEQKGDSIQRDILIGNFFKIKHFEGKETDEIQFAHRSIYEYFVVLYFFESIYSMTSKEEVAGKLGELLKDGHLSKQILEFIKYKFDGMKGFALSDVIKGIFNVMLRDGMTYYTNEQYKNIVEKERNVFSNMLEIVGLWNSSLGEINEKIIIYLQCNREHRLNLKGIILCPNSSEMKIVNLKGVYLREANFSGADLKGAYLGGADLGGANLRGVNLSKADLSGAFLRGTDLKGANLRAVDLAGAYLCNADLRRADLDEADLRGVDLSEADLSEASLNNANLRRADLRKINLRGANLRGAYLIGADLYRADLKAANLSGAYLVRADLDETDLEGANLSEANLDEINLSDVNLDGANLELADLYGTIFNEEQMQVLDEKYDLSKSNILLSEANEVMCYQEYCRYREKG